MKKFLLQLSFLTLLLFFSKVENTNSFYSDEISVSKNTISTACWVAPSVPTGADSIWNTDPTLDWSDSSTTCPLSPTISYQFEIYNDIALTSSYYSSSWLSDSFFTISGIPDGTYYWHVRAEDNFGNTSVYSAPWKLVINRTPAIPSLISPASGTITNPTGIMVMRWNAVSDASYYIFQNTYGQSDHITDTFTILFGVPDGTFWWRVKACNSSDVCSGWSDSWTVTMDGTLPLSTTLTVTGSWSKTVDEKITNGNFDSDLSGWTTAGDVAYNSGTALIGKTSGNNGKQVWENRLMQSFNSGAKTLSFDYNFFTTDGGSHDDPGFFARLNGQQIFATSAASINPENDLGPTFSSGWKTFSYDLSNYSDGQKLNLALYAGNTGGTYDQSWVYIDKVTTTFVAAPSDATFHLTGSDNPGGSGINHFEYNVDNSGWTSDNSFTILVPPIEGPHTLQYRSVDNADNYGPISQTNIIVDDTAPSAITDLKAKANYSPNSITLTWTAPGNDGSVGRASVYDVRYSTNPIGSDADFSAATKVDKVPAPKESGQSESLEVLGLDQNQIYYFAIKTSDETPNVSGLSNPSFDTTAETSYDFNSGDIVINELMWMGTGAGSADEYLELRNMTDRTIDLSGFELMKLNSTTLVMDNMAVSFTGKSIVPHGYFLITNYAPGSGSTQLKASTTANIVDSSLVLDNDALEIELVDSTGYIIDKAGDGGLPFAGENTDGNKYSMERTSVPGDGGNALNWYTCIDALSTTDFFTGLSDRGTPGAENRSENEPIPVNMNATPSATITDDGKNVSFKIINLVGFEKLSYVLTYDSDQAPQGVQGMAELQGASEFEKTGILLGTCSTGGTCTYNTGVKNMHLKIDLTDKNGKITTIDKLKGGEN